MKFSSLLMMLGTCLLMAGNPISTFAQTSGAVGAGGGSTGGGGGGVSSGGVGSGGLGGGGLGGGGLGGGGGNSGSSGFLSSGSGFATGSPTTATSTRGGGAGSTNSIPSASNIFGTTYANPLSLGMATNYYPSAGLYGAPNTTPPTFGKALYTNTTATTNAGAFGLTTTAGAGFSTIGIPRAPVYTTVLNEDVPFKSHSAPELFTNVRAVIDRSSALRYRDNIQINIAGATVVLSGQVANEKERRITEAIVRMTPGVREVQNELKVVGSNNQR